MTLLTGWHGRPAVTARWEYLCSAHMWATVADPNGPVHLRDAAVCWSIQSDRDGRTWTPQAVAETARHGP